MPIDKPLDRVQDLTPFSRNALACLVDQLAIVAAPLEFYEAVIEGNGASSSLAWQAVVSASTTYQKLLKEYHETETI